MMEMEITSYVGVGQLKLGMSREEVREIVPYPVRAITKGLEVKVQIDVFRDAGIHVNYKDPDICNAIEFYGPKSPVLLNREFVNQPFTEELLDWLFQHDDNPEEAGPTIISLQLGIALYVPAIDEPDALVESLFIFERGYFDGMRNLGRIKPFVRPDSLS